MRHGPDLPTLFWMNTVLTGSQLPQVADVVLRDGSTLAVVSVRPGNGSTGTAAVALDDARDRLVRRQLSATYLDPVGEPVEQLLEATRRLGGDLIVVGSRRGVMRRRLLEAALCDVLVVA